MTFKIGDRVKVIDASGGVAAAPGTTGTVAEKSQYYDWIVQTPSGHRFSVDNHEIELVEGASVPTATKTIGSDGGPSDYYDFPGEWSTFNDFIEYKSIHQWKEHSFHLGNIGKAICRWGDKDGASKTYDAKKIVYSAVRVLQMLTNTETVRKYLQKLLDDKQFQVKDKT